ncbi:MAG: aminotransferase class I/II-fold pyridoxal phosphate-dependent enzyme [Planctomycetota bacterium]
MTTPLIPAAADRPGDDPIFALNSEAAARTEEGESIVNSTLGALVTDEGRLMVMESVQEALARIPLEAASAYAPISGAPSFLKGVIRDLFEGSTLESRAVAAATPGGTGACYMALQNFVEPGQSFLTSSYYWGPYRIIAQHAGRGLETFRMYDDAGDFDTEAFATGVQDLVAAQGRALVLVNTPCHNPTGYSFDADDWAAVTSALLAASAQGSVTLLIDFAYGKFAGDRSWREPVTTLVDAGVTVLFAWTASKAFAQYGSRVGACVAVHRDAEQRRRIKNALSYSCRATWSNCNHLGMLAIGEILSDPKLRARSEDEREALRQLLLERVEGFKSLANAAGLRYPRYEGGFFVAVFTPDAEITCRAARERGVYLVPLHRAVRVALCATPASDLPRLVQTLADGVRLAEETTTAATGAATDGSAR